LKLAADGPNRHGLTERPEMPPDQVIRHIGGRVPHHAFPHLDGLVLGAARENERGENERGGRMLETILEQYPTSEVRFQARLELGRHYLRSGGDKSKAIAHLRRLKQLKSDEKPLAGETKEMYLEALYLTGVAQFEVRNYAGSCAVLRKITRDHPNTVWANQAYYYIGMCHFAQRHWKEAIRNLSLVGTFVDPNSPTVDFVEAGRRFYVLGVQRDRVAPAVEGIQARLDATLNVNVTNTISVSGGPSSSSIATAVGVAAKGDGVLQVVGGDEMIVSYVDMNTKDGKKDVARPKKVRVVSTASLSFTVSTYESEVAAAFFGQPLYVLLRDVDLDSSAAAEKATVRVLSRYKSSQQAEGAAEPGAEGEKYRV
ncbi:hypothetical protein LCGC14_2977990, partial [marine sediment metagenome]